MQGGQLVYYQRESDQHLNFRPLYTHTMDCGPNCFSLLRYATWDTCREMAKRTKPGIYTYNIERILNEAYGPGHEWRPINNYNQYNGNHNRSPNFELNDYGEPIADIGHINQYLPKNHATLAFMEGDGYGHYFVILRQDRYLAIDAQSGHTQSLESYIDYLVELGFYQESLLMLTSLEPMQEPNLVTLEMVKRHFPLPKKNRKGSVKHLRRRSRKNKTVSRKAT